MAEYIDTWTLASKKLLGSLVEAMYCILALFLQFRAPTGMI